ncbi:MAG: hypothetical protein ACTSW1_09130 [Candidatus Hodarchaeales archaeon]
MSDLTNRINDAYQSAKSLQKLSQEKDTLIQIIKSAEKLLESERNNEPLDPELLMLLEIGAPRGYALRIKLRGLLSIKKSRLHEVNSNIKQEIEILQKITICPYCRGSGEVMDHGYERFERRIHTTTSSKNCEHCNGTGITNLGEEVEKMVQETLEKVSGNHS